VTKYDVVKQYVQQRIKKGTWKAGEKIPSEGNLAEILGVSRNPVRQALSELVSEGWIYKLRGSGSYVRESQATEAIEIFAFLYSENRRFETEIIHGMTLAVRNCPNRDLHLILRKPGSNTREMIEALHTLDRTSYGGVVFLPVLDSQRSLNRALGATLRKLERPKFVVVQLDRQVPEYDGNFVMTDHRKGAYEMTDYLVRSGHRKIAVLYEHPENTSIGLRFDGVKQRLQEAGIELPREDRICLPWNQAANKGLGIIERLRQRQISCIFCFENSIALEVYHICRDHGIRIPEDLSLCTFDDHSFLGAERDFITCSEQQLENLGLNAVNIVLKNLDASAASATKLLLEPTLRTRRSVYEGKDDRPIET
jgi:GntR family transcriptional regulator of arabinose operon